MQSEINRAISILLSVAAVGPSPQGHKLLYGDGKPARSDRQVGRNDPCHCGSKKKYKKCCLRLDRPSPPATITMSNDQGFQRLGTVFEEVGNGQAAKNDLFELQPIALVGNAAEQQPQTPAGSNS